MDRSEAVYRFNSGRLICEKGKEMREFLLFYYNRRMFHEADMLFCEAWKNWYWSPWLP